jgi:DNA mismatch repair protein MutL
MRIHQLAPDVAAKIAAGEVVERPANVAKELLENSLDAGADEISVEIKEGGQRLLRIIDNGHGILPEDVPLVFQRHATSKLDTAEDLNHIATFGFRGEALYSISAVSHVTLVTRHRSQDFGVQMRVEGGDVVAQNRAGAPVGTMVTVEHLFYNTPARRKYLRKPATEAGRIAAVVQHYALAYPDRRFSLLNDGRLVFQSTGSGDLFDVLAKVYGLENAKQMVAVGEWRPAPGASGKPSVLDTGLASEVDFMGTVEGTTEALAEGDEPALDQVRVYGYASLPTLTRANRTNINLFINRRYVEDRSLTYAVIQAYHTLLQVGRYPIAVIFIDMDPEEVDVNVHPQKTQVRLVHERKVFSAIQRAVRRTIVDHAAIPDMELPPGVHDASGSQGEGVGARNADAGWAQRRENIIDAGRQHELDLFTPPPVSAGAGVSPIPESAAPDAADPSALSAPNSETDASDPSHQTPLAQRKSNLPPLRVVGQAGSMYIIAEGPEGLYLIDQHAAHERILYEKFMEQRYGTSEGRIPQQPLLEPLPLHVGAELTGQVANHLESLNRIGFEIEAFGGDTFLVRAVPAALSGQDPLRTVEEMVRALAEGRNLVSEELEARLVKMVCKRAAIKAGQQLSDIEMSELVRQLEACQSPRTCPHGRPTMIQLSAGELEKAFGRV